MRLTNSSWLLGDKSDVFDDAVRRRRLHAAVMWTLMKSCPPATNLVFQMPLVDFLNRACCDAQLRPPHRHGLQPGRVFVPRPEPWHRGRGGGTPARLLGLTRGSASSGDGRASSPWGACPEAARGDRILLLVLLGLL